MKNIHIIPTDKPSIFYYNEIHKNYFINKKIKMPHLIEDENQNIYITSDEEIKEGDWYYDITLEQIIRANVNSDHNAYIGSCKKIILTTDLELQKDGVQAIDDEFLEWFVKNPSCEEVEFTRPNKCKVVGCDLECILFKTCENIYIGYKIIIPKEEPKQETLEEPCVQCCGTGEIQKSTNRKQSNFECDICNGRGYWNKVIEHKQETLEEAFSNYVNERYHFPIRDSYPDLESAKFGAKWQQEQIGKSKFLQKLRGTLTEVVKDYFEKQGFAVKYQDEGRNDFSYKFSW